MLGLLTFIIIFGIVVVVHEYGHLYFAKKAGILVREFAIGMGPKIFSHRAEDGTLYTIRILPVGGYVRMAGWGDDTTEIKTGTPVTLSLNEAGVVTRINLSSKQLDHTGLPMNVTQYDLTDKLEITGLVIDEQKTYKVDHDAIIVEEDGTELRIAPADLQYQNANVFGRMLTNFAGPLNNFILGLVVFIALMFVQGGVADDSSNRVRVAEDGAMAVAGVKDNDRVLEIEGISISNWNDLTEAVDQSTENLKAGDQITVKVESEGKEKTLEITPKESEGRFYIGVSAALKTGFWDKVLGGIKTAWSAAFAILNALKNIILRPDINQLGGPVAMYQMSNQAAQAGLTSVLSLMGLLSINLGIFNLVPIPALDGGKILFNIIEAIRRKPLKEETETMITFAGVIVMVVLMIAVTWNDIMRAFF